MSPDNNFNTQDAEKDEFEFSITDFVVSLLRNWYFFVISFLITLSVSYIYLRYADDVYRANAKLLVEESEKGSSNLLTNIKSLFRKGKTMENEIYIVKSQEVAELTIKKADISISYFRSGRFKTVELYANLPYSIKIDSSRSQIVEVPIFLTFDENAQKVNVKASPSKDNYSSYDCLEGSTYESQGRVIDTTFDISNTNVIRTAYFSLRLNLMKEKPIDGTKYFFVIHHPLNQALSLKSKIQASFEGDAGASILNISITSGSPQKAANIVNAVASSYNELDVRARQEEASRAIEFIDAQLQILRDSLRNSELMITSTKKSHGSIELSEKTTLIMSQLTEINSQDLLFSQRQYKLNELDDYLNSFSESDANAAPSLEEIADPVLPSLMLRLREMNEQQVFLESKYKTPFEFPEYIELISQIKSLKSQIKENVAQKIKGNDRLLGEINNRRKEIEAQIRSLPEHEQDFIRVRRNFELNNSLVTLLMTKKYEAGITEASIISRIKMLQNAIPSQSEQIAPKRNKVFTIAIGMAVFFPMVLIFILTRLDDKIYHSEQIEKVVQAPILGHISHNAKNTSIINSPKSSLAESFRSLRINLDYIAADNEQKVIGITSTLSGEGKTFCAFNTAAILALSGHKTVVIGGDMRKPKLAEYQIFTTDVGLSTYLINKASVDEIIQDSDLEMLKIIPSGPIPPNPGELLDTDLLAKLIQDLKERFDVIVIDAPPVGLVSDYFSFSKYTSINLFVFRQGYSRLRFMKDYKKRLQQIDLKNNYLIFNDVGFSRGYGYGYGHGGYGYGHGGYGYYDDEKPKKKGLFGRFR